MSILIIKLTDNQLDDLADLIAKKITLEKPNPQCFLNKKQMCEFLNISNNTLDRWIAEGLPVIKINRTCRFNIEDVTNWMNKR
ncbi:DNA-binding protein [Falseniella ignava]|uniref:DNA-binding protein n=1 Tax=Falseniella ignava TaxID=137730 RepID=A0A2I1K4R5_9LACT|nr:helix-turn-helix domain-containing protein [Falseniella ignava]PKY90577.1 DNA-binding protein [Falseniella ignava]